MNIYERLKELNFNEKNIHVIEERSIEADNINLKTDFVIFATKHKSESQKKTLTVHNPGNWGKAELGGKDFSLPKSNPIVLKNAFLELKKLNNLDYETSGEVTHHGPCISLPSLFIEIGSSENEWEDKEAAKIIAQAIVNLTKKKNNENYKVAIGLGGGHYMPSFNKILERTDIAFSYICPKHNLENLNKDLIEQAVNNSAKKVDFFLLDWKGLGQYKQKVKSLLEEFNIEIKRNDKI